MESQEPRDEWSYGCKHRLITCKKQKLDIACMQFWTIANQEQALHSHRQIKCHNTEDSCALSTRLTHMISLYLGHGPNMSKRELLLITSKISCEEYDQITWGLVHYNILQASYLAIWAISFLKREVLQDSTCQELLQQRVRISTIVFENLWLIQ